MSGPSKEGTGNTSKDIGGYYLNPAGQGEPPGRWAGKGLEKFGLEPGSEVAEKTFRSIYSGKHPETGEQLGRKPSNHARFDDHLARLIAAEPYATAERMEELRREAAQATRASSAYVDVTNEWSKSISLMHASIRENMYHAKLTGDTPSLGYWTHLESEFSEALQLANRAGMEYAQEHAGYTRTGNHTRTEGKDTGRWADADLVIASFLQGTSRAGDMHDHEHNLFWSKVFTQEDGRVRALDTMSLRSQLPAIQAVIAATGEAELSRRFGFEWVDRPDGKGREVKGVPQELVQWFSVRSVQVDSAVRAKAEQWERDHGTPPSEAQMRYMKDAAWYETRQGKDEGPLDWDEHARRWDSTSGGKLAALFPSVSGASTSRSGPSRAGQQEAMRVALQRVQEKSSTWTRMDLAKAMAASLDTSRMTPAKAAGLVMGLTDRAIAGEVSHVLTTDAPEYPQVPDSLRRESDGKSVYTRPWAQRYSTGTQLSIEQRLVNAANTMGSPVLDKQALAEKLGSTPAVLAAQLRVRAVDSVDVLPSGLRLDQAAALFHVLTTPCTANVLVGCGGSGKSHCAAYASKVWKELTGKDVIGVTPSQASRNVLRNMGMEAYNFADYLGHTKEERGARGQYNIEPGTLLILDESSMFSTPDMTDIVEGAVSAGAHAIVIGDHEQLQAVESGGGMMLLAAENDYVQLSTPVRFRNEWERDATLHLRAGNTDVLHTYEEHGRLRGGTRDEVMDATRRDYVAKYLSGNDVLLMAESNILCQELSEQIRSDLIHLGIVDESSPVELHNGSSASAGDLVINRDSNYKELGIANGDTLRIDSLKGKHAMVSKLQGSKDGQRIYGESFKIPQEVITSTCRLGYAVTGHCAQGRTVDAGQAIITGAEDRQWVYVAGSRGRDSNKFYVVTPITPADPEKGTVPAPSIARYDRAMRDRAAIPEPALTDKELQDRQEREQDGRVRDRIAVMSDVLGRDGGQQSAIQTQRHELSLTDDLGILNVILAEETRPVQQERHAQIVRDALPEELKDRLSHTSTWLYRTLRQAELSGLDAKEVVDRAVATHTFEGLRDHMAGLKSWIEKDNGAMTPVAKTQWSGNYEKTGDAEKDEYLSRVATAMDVRRERLGPFIAKSQPLYVIRALGPVSDDPAARADWEEKARAIETYREVARYRSETDAIGPEPGAQNPEGRQLWRTAFEALGPKDGFDARALPDGALLSLRQSYERETAWAPPYVARELSAARSSAEEHDSKVIRAEAEAAIARQRGDHETARRHGELAQRSRQSAAILREHERHLEAAHEVRREWDGQAERILQDALAADSEYRQRHPDNELEPLKSLEPEAISREHREELEPADPAEYAAPAWLAEVEEKAQRAAEELAQRATVRVPSEIEDELGELAWPERAQQERDAILQPPAPEIPPAPEVVRLHEERSARGKETQHE